MSKGLVLLSGVNGYIAAVTAKHLLEKGYSVRGTVRKHSSAQPLIDGPLKSYAASGAFTTVEVPDITVPGAFDEAVKGVTTILHLASPVSFGFTDPEPIIHAAVNGTKTMLQSALLAGPQLQSVTVLSSIVSIMNGREAPYTLTEADWNGWAEAKVAELGKNSPGVAIYCASKVAAEKEFWKFRDEVKPAFKMAALNPVFVIGPPLIAPSTVDAVSETIRPIWNIFSGGAFEEAGAAVGWSVDVRDVAKLLEYFVEHPQEVDGERYIAKSAWLNPQAMADAMRKAFPDAVGRIVEGVKGQGYQADGSVDKATQVNIDSSKATKLIGEWIPIEQSVVDTAKSFVGLL